MYSLQVIFAAFRIIIAFYVIFGVISPLFLKTPGKTKGIESILYHWIGMGGLLLIVVLLLVSFQLYDIISLFVVLIFLPLTVYLIRQFRSGKSFRETFKRTENKTLKNHVFQIEKWGEQGFQNLIIKVRRYLTFDHVQISRNQLILIIAALGAVVIRLLPVIQNSSPFTRNWYFELETVKNLSYQEYFTQMPEPRGMHSLIHIFSSITQVSPEMILHIMGALTAFLLTLIIYWVIRNISSSSYGAAAVFGASLYAIMPAWFMPISVELQSQSSSIALALCFAIPTIVILARDVRLNDSFPIFYVFMGIIATGLSDVFVFLMILLPLLLISFMVLLFEKKPSWIIRGYAPLFLASLIAISPYLLFVFINDISIYEFFRQQLLDVRVFSYYPDLILNIYELSTLYLYAAIVYICIILIRIFALEEDKVRDEVIFIVMFAAVAFIYTPHFDYAYSVIDPDQLTIFYSVLIAIFGGLLLNFILKIFQLLYVKIKIITEESSFYINYGIVSILVAVLLLIQGGIKTQLTFPQTLPNGFFNAYYKIISERLPYSYAIVSPETDRRLAQNRHYFMNYSFFLDNYGSIDSLYQEYLTMPVEERETEEVPPASIFLFVEKAPYGTIQQGILFDAPSTMRDMEQWVENYQNLEGRTLLTFYENQNTIVYEIVNREDESKIKNVLLNMYPDTLQGRAKIFQ